MDAVQEAGEQLFSSFQTVLPLVAGTRKGPKKLALKTVEEGLRKFYAEARAQREQRRLGVIARARVAFYLQQRLIDSGYPPELVRQVLFSMLLSAFVGRHG